MSTKVDCNIHHKHKHISGLLFTCFDFSFVWFRRKLCSTMFCRLFMLIRLSEISRNQKVVELQYHQCLPHFYCNYCHAFMFIKGFHWNLYCTVMINQKYYVSDMHNNISFDNRIRSISLQISRALANWYIKVIQPRQTTCCKILQLYQSHNTNISIAITCLTFCSYEMIFTMWENCKISFSLCLCTCLCKTYHKSN